MQKSILKLQYILGTLKFLLEHEGISLSWWFFKQGLRTKTKTHFINIRFSLFCFDSLVRNKCPEKMRYAS